MASSLGGQGNAVLLPDRGDQQHVGAFLARAHVEPFVGMLLEHARGERPEALAVLDLEVHRGLHRWRAGVADDAPRAERSRAELHPALEPADHLAVGHQAGDVIEQVGLVVEAFDALCAGRFEHPVDCSRR